MVKPAKKKITKAVKKRVIMVYIRQQYNPGLMTELDVYPSIWDEETALEYLLHYFRIIQTIYASAAVNNEGMIIFLN